MNHPCGSCGHNCGRSSKVGAFGSGSGHPVWTPMAKANGNCVIMRPKTTGNCACPPPGPKGPLKRNKLTLGTKLPIKFQSSFKNGRPLTSINEGDDANARSFLQSINELSQPQRGDHDIQAAQCQNPGHHHHHQHHADGTCCVGPQHVGCHREPSVQNFGQSSIPLNMNSYDQNPQPLGVGYAGVSQQSGPGLCGYQKSTSNLRHSPSRCLAGHPSGSQSLFPSAGFGQQVIGHGQVCSGHQHQHTNACSFCDENHYTGVCGQQQNQNNGNEQQASHPHFGPAVGPSQLENFGSQSGLHQSHVEHRAGNGTVCPFHGFSGHNNHHCNHKGHQNAAQRPQTPFGPAASCGQDLGCRICVEPPKLFPGCNGRENLGSQAIDYDKREFKPKVKKIDPRHPGRHFEKHGHDLRIYRNGEYMNLTYQGHIPGEKYVYGKCLPCATTFAKKRLETNIPYEVLDINGCCYCP